MSRLQVVDTQYYFASKRLQTSADSDVSFPT